MKKTLKLSFILPILLTLFCCQFRDKLETQAIFRYEKTITVDGLNRTYTLNLPPNYYENSNLSLVIALHGGGGSGKQCETDYNLTEKANAENFAIVYPDGVQSDGILRARTWNAGTCCDYAVEKNINDVHL